MATIRKRNDSYQIVVSCGYDINGKHICRYKTYTPEKGMTKRQIDNELNRQAVLFEEACKNGLASIAGKVKLSEFIPIFFQEYAVPKLKAKSIVGYNALVPVVDAALGHLRIDKIQPHHLNSFYINLAEEGARRKVSYSPVVDLKAIAKEKGLTATRIARDQGVGASSIRAAFKGNNVFKKTAVSICSALDLSMSKAFEAVGADVPLSTETIRHYHRFLSSVFSYAVKSKIIATNPCARATIPKAKGNQKAKKSKKHTNHFDEEEVKQVLKLLESEDIQRRTAIKLLLHTGMRREEICGLEWSDIDFVHSVISVERASVYIPKNDLTEESGIITSDTKNEDSKRYIRISGSVNQMLKDYKEWQMQRQLQMGDRWEDHDRLFTTATGTPIHPDTLTRWFSEFTKRNGLPHVTIHGLRHTNATLLINSYVPITTIAARLGHANPSTTTKIYTHAIKRADAVAAEQLEVMLSLPDTEQGEST